jgi:hypothetical protein
MEWKWDGDSGGKKGIRDCNGSRQGRVEPRAAGVNCTPHAAAAAPEEGEAQARGDEEE